jgi:uncharacterized protein (TIGR03435 family)
MQLTVRSICLIAISCTLIAGLWGQPAIATKPTFEVVSIRPSSTDLLQAAQRGALIGMMISPGHVAFGQVTLLYLIKTAFNVSKERIVAPDWVLNPGGGSLLFDIEAKIPAGANIDQVPQMIQTLLAERFGFRARKEGKLAEAYALETRNAGSRLQPSDRPVSPEELDKVTTTFVAGGRRVSMSTLKALAGYLSENRMDLPVIDKTGMSGTFNIVLDLPLPSLSTFRDRGLTGQDLSNAMSEETRRILVGAVNGLGLNLVRQREVTDFIVVDSVNKVPTEN